MKLGEKIKKLWQWFKTPSRMAIGAVLLIGFVVGASSLIVFNTGLAMTNTEQFCLSCHEMRDNVYEEYVNTVHYTNRTGIRATCPDCHVPKEFVPKMIRKIQASKEIYAKALGLVDTKQKFEDARSIMAEREWARMKANNSQECRNCHNFEYMDATAQKTVAAALHSDAMQAGQTCIDCHKGIAHKLPRDLTVNKAFH